MANIGEESGFELASPVFATDVAQNFATKVGRCHRLLELTREYWIFGPLSTDHPLL